MPLLGNTGQIAHVFAHNSSENIIFSGHVHANTFVGKSTTTLQEITENESISDQIITLTNGTNATSKITGALQLAGGLGVRGDVYATSFHGDGSGLTDISSTLQEITENESTSDQIITLTNGTNATSKTTGALQLTGGLGVGGDVYATSFHGDSFHGDGSGLTDISSTLQEITENESTSDQIITLTNGTNATSKTTGALQLTGGLGVGGDVYATSFHGDGSGLTDISSTLQEITENESTSDQIITLSNASPTTGALSGAIQVTNGGMYVSGNIFTGENLTVTGNLVVSGNTTTINSNSLTVEDSIIQLANGNNSGTKDTGLIFGKPNSNVALFYDTSETKLQIGLTDSHAGSDTINLLASELPVNINGSVTATSFSGSGSGLTNIPSTLQEITENGTTTDQEISLTNTTDSTSTTTGALKLSGGLGVAGNVHASFLHGNGSNLTGISSTLQAITEGGSTTDQIITFANTTDSTSTTTGAVNITGGLGVAKKIYAGDDVTAFSDKRHKSNIERIENALDKVCHLSGYTFDYNGERKTGVLAQEIKEVLPEAVYGSEDTTYSVAYGNLAGIIIEAIKELKNEIQELKNN